ncbi:MAG: peptidylprolyl isomerase, partial [Halodesulfurarchaeum sp.]
MAIESGDSVTIEYTGRLTDGTVFDTSLRDVAEEEGIAEAQPDREFAPLTFEVGAGEIIEGLEDGLIGKEAGDEPTVTIQPEDAYGEWTEEQVREYDPAELEEMLGGQSPEVGQLLETRDGRLAEITSVEEDAVTVDFNHQLAGETLEFDVEIV